MPQAKKQILKMDGIQRQINNGHVKDMENFIYEIVLFEY